MYININIQEFQKGKEIQSWDIWIFPGSYCFSFTVLKFKVDGVVSESRLAQGHCFHPLNGNNDLIHRLRIMQIIMR